MDTEKNKRESWSIFRKCEHIQNWMDLELAMRFVRSSFVVGAARNLFQLTRPIVGRIVKRKNEMMGESLL